MQRQSTWPASLSLEGGISWNHIEVADLVGRTAPAVPAVLDDEELVKWLQYPLEISAEACCPELRNDASNRTVELGKECEQEVHLVQTMKFGMSHCSQCSRLRRTVSMSFSPSVSKPSAEIALATESCVLTDSKVISPSTSATLRGHRKAPHAPLVGPNVSRCLTHNSIKSVPSVTERDTTASVEVCCKGVDIHKVFNQCLSGEDELRIRELRDILESSSELTLSSSTRGSGGPIRKVGKVGEVKEGELRDAEYQSKDLESCLCDAKKPAVATATSMKRRRTAETHNQSERRRRDRINEKLKSLQEVIPHANKSDKASLLEGAIEYLITLRSQLHAMSYRSSMHISPMLISDWLKHQQMPRVAGLPQTALFPVSTIPTSLQ